MSDGFFHAPEKCAGCDAQVRYYQPPLPKGRRYGSGRYVGEDGEPHTCPEKSDFVTVDLLIHLNGGGTEVTSYSFVVPDDGPEAEALRRFRADAIKCRGDISSRVMPLDAVPLYRDSVQRGWVYSHGIVGASVGAIRRGQ